jgi:hypothetical protein
LAPVATSQSRRIFALDHDTPQMQNKLRIFSEIGDPACVAHVFFHIINTGSEDEFIVNIQWWKSPNCGGSKHGRG